MDARGFGDSLIKRLLEHALETIPDALGVGLSLVRGRRPGSIGAVGVAADLDPLQWAVEEGPLVDALTAELSQRISLTEQDGRWPRLAAEAGEAWRQPAGCIVAAGSWTDLAPSLVSLYLSVEPTAEHAAALDRHEPVLVQSAAMVEYCAGEELKGRQLLEMTRHRRVIEQAKGVVGSLIRCDVEEAFATLSRASQHYNVRLRELATALVEAATGAPVFTEEGEPAVVGASARSAAEQLLELLRAGPLLPPPRGG